MTYSAPAAFNTSISSREDRPDPDLVNSSNERPCARCFETGERYKSFLEAAMDRKLADIKPTWDGYAKKVYDQREAILRLPVSTILPDRQIYERFAAHYQLTNFIKKTQLL